MNYAEIKQYDVANGPGVRVSLFVSGCTHHCKECFNPETWDFKYGKPFTEETIQTMYPLISSSLKALEDQVKQKGSTDEITYSADAKYTSLVLINAIDTALDKARK